MPPPTCGPTKLAEASFIIWATSRVELSLVPSASALMWGQNFHFLMRHVHLTRPSSRSNSALILVRPGLLLRGPGVSTSAESSETSGGTRFEPVAIGGAAVIWQVAGASVAFLSSRSVPVGVGGAGVFGQVASGLVGR